MGPVCRPELDEIKDYKPGTHITKVKAQLNLDEFMKLASNESPYPPFAPAVQAMEAVLGELNRYPDPDCTVLREKLSQRLRVSGERILIGNGSNELARLIAQVTLSPGEEVVMPWPSFIIYPTIAKIMRGVPRRVPLADHRPDLVAMADAVTEKTKVVFICSPNNPTGTAVSREEVRGFLDSIRSDVVVVFDQAYQEFVTDDEAADGLDFLDDTRPVVVLRTFSKIYGLAGCRIGYGVAPDFLVRAVQKVREPFNINSVAQAGAVASLDCQQEVSERRSDILGAKDYLYEQFDELGLDYVPSEANFILVDIGLDSREAYDRLLKRGFIVRTGDIFGYPTWLRITVGTKDECKALIHAIQEEILEGGGRT